MTQKLSCGRALLSLFLSLALGLSPTLATVGTISTAEKIEEEQYIGALSTTHPQSCTVTEVQHVVYKGGVLFQCILMPSTAATYQYVPVGSFPGNNSIDDPNIGYDFGDPNRAWRDGHFSRDVFVRDPNNVPAANESTVSLTIEGHSTDSDTTIAGVVIHGGEAGNSATAPKDNRGVIRPSQNTSPGRAINLGSFNYPFQHIYIDSAAEIYQGSATSYEFRVDSTGTIRSRGGSSSSVSYPNYEIDPTGSAGALGDHQYGVISDWSPRNFGSCAAQPDLGADPNQSWRDLDICQDASIGGDLNVTGTITGATITGDVQCLTSPDGGDGETTVCLTDDGTDQTLTGDTGDLIVIPTTGLRLDSSTPQVANPGPSGAENPAFEMRDTVGGDGSNSLRGYNSWYQVLRANDNGAGALDPTDPRSIVSGVYSTGNGTAPALVISRPGINNVASFNALGMSFGQSWDFTNDVPDANTFAFKLGILSTENRFQSNRQRVTFTGAAIDDNSIEFITAGDGLADPFILFFTKGQETVGTTVAPIQFQKEDPFQGTQNWMEATLDTAGTPRIRQRWNQLGQTGWADTSDPNWMVDLVFTSSTALTADRQIIFDMVNTSRTIELVVGTGGNITLDNWFDQDVSTTGGPTFNNVTTDLISENGGPLFFGSAATGQEFVVRGTLVSDHEGFFYVPTSDDQITGNQDPYFPTDSGDGDDRTVHRLTSDGAYNISGIDASRGRTPGVTNAGKIHVFINIGANNLTFEHANATTAEDDILSGTGGNLVVGTDDAITMWYDDVSDAWRVLSCHGCS